MWNAQNASHIHTASTAATGSNPMPNQNSTNNLPDFQFRKVRKKLDTTRRSDKLHSRIVADSHIHELPTAAANSPLNLRLFAEGGVVPCYRRFW